MDPNTIEYAFWPNFRPDTIRYGFCRNCHTNTIEYGFGLIFILVVCTKYNMIVSDIQCRVEGETSYIRYKTGANIVLCL